MNVYAEKSRARETNDQVRWAGAFLRASVVISDVASRLLRTLSPGSVVSDPSRDAYIVQGVLPDVIAQPSTIEEVAAVLRIANESRAAVTPWGGGVHQSLGYPPQRIDVLLSLARLRHVLAYEPQDLVVSAQAGATVEAIGLLLASHEQMLPIDPWHPERASLGGVISANVAGPRRLLHGTCRDFLVGTTVVHADGTMTKAGGMVVKNVSGFDLPKLYLGSLGTLAVIVEANFKLAPLPPVTRLMRFDHCALTPSLSFADGVVRSALGVAAVVIAGGDEESVTSSVFCEGTAQVVDRQERDLRAMAKASGLPPPMRLDAVGAGDALRAIAEFGWTDEPALSEALIRVHVPPDRVGAVLEHARRCAHELDLKITWVAQMGIARIDLAVDGRPSADFPFALAALQDRLVKGWSRSVVARCAPQLKAGLDVWGATPPGLAHMRRIKAAFDPHAILNSGRYVRGIDP